MPRTMIASNVSHDATTEYLEAWSKKIEEKSRSYQDVEFFDIRKERVNRKDFEAFIEEKKPRLIIIHSHGTSDSILDFKMEALVKVNENEEIFNGKIVHSMACETGKILAERCVEIGTVAYIGYSQKFRFWGSGYETNKGDDPVAAFTLDPAFEVVMALIEGDSVERAIARSQEMARTNLRRLTTTSLLSAQDRDDVMSALFHNTRTQVSFGDKTAVF